MWYWALRLSVITPEANRAPSSRSRENATRGVHPSHFSVD
jgi:hypothetical protein